MVRTISSLVVVSCLVYAAFIFVFRVGILQTYFPELSNSRDLMRITVLLSVSLFFSLSIYRGKLIWFLGGKLGLKRWLAIMFLIGLFVAATAPMLRLFFEMESFRNRVQFRLNHIAIRDAGRTLLAEPRGSSEYGEVIEKNLYPHVIAESSPSSLRIRDGILIIGYGGGFGRFGLVVVSEGEPIPYGEELAEGIAYFDHEK